MPSLRDIPGAGAFYERSAMNQQQPMQELQQAGALVGLRDKMEERRRQEEYRAAVAGLGPNPSHEQIAQLASKYAPPGEALKIHQGAQDRAATREVQAAAAAERRDAARAQIDLRYDALAQNAKTAEDRLAIDARRAADKVEADKRHDETLRLLGGMRADAAANKAPPGYRFKPDRSLEAIPGGPADTKLQGALNTDTASLSTSNANFDRLATAANEVMRHPGLGGITGLQGAFPNVPGGAAANAKAKLETLKAQVGFGVLQELRNASKTGGALGQVTEKEHVLLQNALAALDQAQDEPQMKESLQKIIDYTAGAKVRLQQAYNMRHAAQPAPAAAPPVPGGQFQEGQTATGPGGQKIEFKGGAWRPVTSP